MLGDEVYDQLCAMLGSGAWVKDSRLPSEQALAKRFAVSRPILRQALARLRAEGRVQSRKGAGTYVREVGPPAGLSYEPLGNIPEVRGFLEFRCVLESEMAARAAGCSDAAALAGLRAAQERLEAALAAGAPGVEEDIAFHLSVGRACGNRFFLATLEALGEQMGFGIRLTRELAQRPVPGRIPLLIAEHARISTAIEAGQPEAARAAMQEHLNNGIRRLFGS